MCGEHPGTRDSPCCAGGSSPRVRGTPRPPDRDLPGFRFIPACAGNTGTEHQGPKKETVHPRVCGEHGIRAGSTARALGSSPRVRGTRAGRVVAGAGDRFIPACAGNTSALPARSSPASVHPRVCGEHAQDAGSIIPESGSSPRVRGTHHPQSVIPVHERFIPACAGNTSPAETSQEYTPVHPRVCGEHISDSRETVGRTGSSPRVRGTPRVLQRPAQHDRFIPACAGNTDL